MKKSMIRSTALILCMIFTIGALTACGGASQSPATTTASQTNTAATTAAPSQTSDKSDWEIDKSPVTINFFYNASWYLGKWEDNTAKRITEDTGVSVNFSKPVSDDGQKLKVMIAGNELPDMICLDKNDPLINQMIKNGQLYAYEDLAAQYAPKFYDNAIEEFKTNYKAADGKTYFYPSSVESKKYQENALKYNGLITTNQNTILIRKDYYEEAGSPDVSTPEAYVAALEKIHAKHPDKIAFYSALNPQNMTVTGLLNYLGTQFGLPQYFEDNGSLKCEVRDPRFMNAVKFMNSLASKKLLTKDSFIDVNDTNRAKITNGDVISYAWTLADEGIKPKDNPNTEYISINPFPDYQQYRTGTGWTATLITKSAKTPDRDIRFMEYLASPYGTMRTAWGGDPGDKFGTIESGPYYFKDGDKVTFFPEYVTEKKANWDPVSQKSGIDLYWFAANWALWQEPWWNKSDEKMTSWNNIYGKKVVYKPEFDSYLDPDPSSEEGIIKQKITDFYKNDLAKMVFAKDAASLTTEYNNFIQKLETLGLPKLEAYWDKLYKAKLASMKK